jgi:hypothetical protein
MNVLLGSLYTDHGTVETSPEGLVYAGPDYELASWSMAPS